MLFTIGIADAQTATPGGGDPIPPDWLRKMPPLGRDSLMPTAERRNQLAALRRPTKSEPKNILVLSPASKTTRDQDVQYLAQLEKKYAYRVNSSAIVSKYIGETEKNLERIFADAAVKQSILFFDEAGQLFSRSEQPESVAKYIDKLARDKNVISIFWCEDDCLKWLRNSRYAVAQ